MYLVKKYSPEITQILGNALLHSSSSVSRYGFHCGKISFYSALRRMRPNHVRFVKWFVGKQATGAAGNSEHGGADDSTWEVCA